MVTKVAVVSVLVVDNVLTNAVLPSPAYVPVRIVTVVVLVAVARAGGFTLTDLGLRLAGATTGVVVAFGIAAALVLGAVVPAIDSFYRDGRAAGMGATELLYQVLLRIPVGTAVAEEIAFRGVVFAVFGGAWSGAIVSSLLFGLWHVLPARDMASLNAGFAGTSTALVVALAVVGTAAAGLGFSWLRHRDNNVVSPFVVHAAINVVSFTLAWARIN